MGAKTYLTLALIALLTGGCETARRLAPPGFFKYEDIAGDAPANPEIQARVEARKAEAPEKFPVLSTQPDKSPEGLDGVERAILQSNLKERRSAVADDIEQDKERAKRERALEQARLEARRAKLEAEIKRQRLQAAREKAENAKATAGAGDKNR